MLQVYKEPRVIQVVLQVLLVQQDLLDHKVIQVVQQVPLVFKVYKDHRVLLE